MTNRVTGYLTAAKPYTYTGEGQAMRANRISGSDADRPIGSGDREELTVYVIRDLADGAILDCRTDPEEADTLRRAYAKTFSVPADGVRVPTQPVVEERRVALL